MRIMNYIWNDRGYTSKTIILAAIFGILLAATIVQRSQRKVVAEKIKMEEAAPIVADFNPDDVYKIEIYEILSKTILEKRNGIWGVGVAQVMPNMSQTEKESAEITAWDKADQDAVREVLETVKTGLSGKELVSRNRDKKIEYRVGILGSKYVFKNEKGEVITCIDVGEKSADFTGTYVSTCDEDEVYKVPGVLEYIFKRDFNGWRDKQVFDFPKDKVIKIEARSAKWSKPVIVEKNAGTGWIGKSPNEFSIDEAAFDGVLTKVSTYKSKGFPERMDPGASITNIDLEIFLTLEDGKTYSLTFGTSERVPEKLVQSSETGIIYAANFNDVEELSNSIDVLMSGS